MRLADWDSRFAVFKAGSTTVSLADNLQFACKDLRLLFSSFLRFRLPHPWLGYGGMA